MSNSSLTVPDGVSGAALPMWRAKLRVASIHALASALVVGALGAVMIALWYPWPIFLAAGAATLLALVAACDVIVGPLLTLIVYRPAKPSLRFDLGTIVVLQAVAFLYGAVSVYEARPVFQLFVVDRFELVAAPEIDAAQLARAPEGLRMLSRSGPRLAAARQPADPREREALLFSSAAGGADVRALPQYYVKYEDARDAVLARARPLEQLAKHNDPRAVEAVVARYADQGAVRFLPLSARDRDLTVIVDATTAEVRGIENLQPW